MSKPFQPILLEDVRIRWPGFAIRRIALNQHMPRIEALGEHRHRHAQILLYLRGEGVQHLENRAVPVRRGSALFVPPSQVHRFEKARSVRPICLVLDFETVEPPPWREATVLASGDLAKIERWLVSLHGMQHGRTVKPDDFSIGAASLILRILATLRDSLQSDDDPAAAGPITHSVRRQIQQQGLTTVTPGSIAAALGRSLDHLNRTLRAESGHTLGELINQTRLELCGQLLRDPRSGIGEVAKAAGMPNANYFARWFRRQTGQTPTHWRAAMR